MSETILDVSDTESSPSSCDVGSASGEVVSESREEIATEGESGDETTLATRPQLAQQIRNSGKVTFATVHVSGVRDEATASHNIIQTAQGLPAKRSSYGTAPGGQVWLNVSMLQGMLALLGQYTFRVSELVGGSHTSGSRHYYGIVFDVDIINGRLVSASHPSLAAFVQRARQLGAHDILKPGDAGHATHVHLDW